MILNTFKKQAPTQGKQEVQAELTATGTKAYRYSIEVSESCQVKENNFFIKIYKNLQEKTKLMASFEAPLNEAGFYYVAEVCKYLNINCVHALEFSSENVKAIDVSIMKLSDINNKIPIANDFKFLEIKKEIQRVKK